MEVRMLGKKEASLQGIDPVLAENSPEAAKPSARMAEQLAKESCWLC